MKTPMQQHMEWLHKKYISHLQDEETGLALEVWYCLKNAEQMLEKEKAVIIDAYNKISMNTGEQYYNETFNTNQENLQDSTNGYTYYPQENKTVFNTKEK